MTIKMMNVITILFITMVTMWYPIVTEDLPPVNPDSLDPSAAHVCQRTEREGYTKKVSETRYKTETTNTWCFAVPPRCTEYRLVSYTAYKIITLYRDRVHYFCCNGYKPLLGINYCVPECKNDCMVEENHGYCITPGQCKCNNGFSGTYCESGCADDRWGPNCTNTCNCGTHGSCDPYTGNCLCHIGYTGYDCSQPCINSFGLNCAHPCACENGATCNNINGRCTCAPGFYGAYCHKTCDYSTSDQQGCEQTCPCQNGGQCDDITGECNCLPGYKGTYCTEICDAFHWGQNCSNNCTCNFGVCDPMSGICTCQMGYAGHRCEVKCPDGTYGVGCLTKCGCKNNGKCYFNSKFQQIRCNCTNTGYHGDVCNIRDCPPGEYVDSITNVGDPVCISCNCVWAKTNSCHPLNGSCTCSKGYHGERCTEECSMPFYGDHCSQVCQCKHGDCHHVTGQCSRCYAGYIGEDCLEKCPGETWGLQCKNKCECLNGATCHTNTGYCDCAPGYYGMRCENECPVNKFGPHCTGDCDCNTATSECNPYTGQCMCRPGYRGYKCEETCPSGYYGIHCRHHCDCDTISSVCDPKSGHCICKPGFYGPQCQGKCKSVFWGPYCGQECQCNNNGECIPETGACLCYSGYYGKNCDEDQNGILVVGMQTGQQTKDKSSSVGVLPLILAIVIPCIVLILIIIAILYYYKKKIRKMNNDNFQVSFRNHTDTMVPNGGQSVGVVNPSYDEDNLRDERRYPHLSQRVSQQVTTVPPPLPHRLDSCDACVDSDDVKLNVTLNDTCRPVSSQYAEVDDPEDRYTTLKSINGEHASNIKTQCDSDSDDNMSCDSDIQNKNTCIGFTNQAYADTDDLQNQSNHLTSSLFHPITAEISHHDLPDANIAPSGDMDQVPSNDKASNDIDVDQVKDRLPATTIVANDYVNHIENGDVSIIKTSPTSTENVYDTPYSGPVTDPCHLSTDSNHYKTPVNNGYMSPVNNGYMSPVNNGYMSPVNNGYMSPVNNGYMSPVNSGYMVPVNNTPVNIDTTCSVDIDTNVEDNDGQELTCVDTSLFNDSDQNSLIKSDHNVDD
ncbi:hypothetical protein ACF0H5_024220 [Mactra antiquata]